MQITENNILKIELQENDILLFTTLKNEITDNEWIECQEMINKWYNFCKDNNIIVSVLVDMTSISFLKSKFYISWKQQYLENKETFSNNSSIPSPDFADIS